MVESTSSYRSIAKSNALFGSVQIFNILIGIVRSKLVAILLGPSGMGIMGLFNSTIDLVKSISNMGLQTSAVRDVALAYDSGDVERISVTGKVLSRMVWLTGLLGAFLMFVFASQLSQFSFGNSNYVIHIRALSVVVLFSQLLIGRNVLLQGMRQLKKLALANVIGGIAGLFFTIPFYYVYGEDGIVPALIINSVIIYVIAIYFTRKLSIKSSIVSWRESFVKGATMIKMGFLINLSALLDASVAYIIKNVLQAWGTVAEVGLYTAGFAIVQSYVGLIFNAIGTDYYPRLIIASSEKEKSQELVNQQFEIMILVLLPLVLLFVMCSQWALYVLYSSEFTGVYLMISWMAVGMIFRAYSWCPGFMFLAKNDSKLYLTIYVVTVLAQLLIYIVFYYCFSLTGIGIAFLVLYVLSSISSVVIVKWRYGINYNSTCNKLLIIATLLSGGALALCYWDYWFRYILQALLLVMTSIYCLRELNKRLDLSMFLRKLKRK